MSQKKNYFDEEKRISAAEKINRIWKDQTCDVCREKSWTLAEDMVMPVEFAGGHLVMGGPSYPQIMVICNSCGNTKYFNANVMGLFKEEADKEEGGNG